MKKPILSLAIILCFNLGVFGQSSNPGFHITTRLKTFLSAYIPEKAYLQFDKPYYAAGDTIYFKAYVTQGERHQLSDISGVLHVDLINTENKIDQSIKLQLDSGVCSGDFALQDSLSAGNYRVIAYTQWMRNMGETSFFDRTIFVGSLKKEDVSKALVNPPLQLVSNKADVQFFPEGGKLVTGIRTKVSFKAIGTNGLAINIKGVILDNDSREICNFASTHLGMGYFFLNPEKGKIYKAKLIFDDGSQDIVYLPKPEASGITLSVNNDSIPIASVRIEANAAYYQANQNKDFFLVIYSGGIAVTVTCKLDSSVIDLGITKRRLHTGVATITLFSPNEEPVCERLLFVQNFDQLSLHITADKTAYTKREKVKLLLTAKNPTNLAAAGHFSVSVIDETKLPEEEVSERTILTDLLLTSDLTGNVEQPNYYFSDTSENARNSLDVLMLTQGYRSFDWKRVLDTNYVPLAYKSEKGLEISGRLTNLSGKPIVNGTVMLMARDGGSLLSSVSNNKGLFRFSNLVFTDTTLFVLSAENSKGLNSTKLTYFTNNYKPEVFVNRQSGLQIGNDTSKSINLKNIKIDQSQLINNGQGKAVILKEVKIKAYKRDDQYKTQSLAGVGHADQVMHADEIERIGGQLSTSLDGRLRGVGFSNGTPYLRAPVGNGPMLVVIDGAEVNAGNGPVPFDINNIPSSQVETVEVLKYASTGIYGMDGANGVLIITSKQGGDIKENIASVGVLPIAPIGFYKSRKFYSPKYDYTNISSKQPDLRSTIYWKPEVKTDKDGNASSDYYNADATGVYKVVIEGIDNNGNIGRLVYSYKVK